MTGGFAFAAILAAAIVPAQPPTETYAWPLDLPRELTSSFGEYRPGRYHMGIDLRTGPIGKDVHAAADGYVSRIRCSPYGYGKAVYIQLDDGNSVVYAHLSDFAPALRDYVRRVQHEREIYTVDLTPKPGEFRIKKGELIAKSGQTGIGVPHLHYELRDKDGVPINPRLLGVMWPDETPPIIRAVAVIPLSPRPNEDAGEFWPSTISLLTHDGKPIPGETELKFAGRVAFAADVVDPAAGGSSLGIRRVTATASGREIFTVRTDRISYDHGEDGAIAYLPLISEDWRKPTGRYLMLWRAPGNDAAGYAVTPGDGSFLLQDPGADILFTAEDFAGNTSTATLHLTRHENKAVTLTNQDPKSEGDPDFLFNGFALWASVDFTGKEKETPYLVVSGSFVDRVPLRYVTDNIFQTGWLPQFAFADLRVSIDHPRVRSKPHRFVFLRRGTAAKHLQFGDLVISTEPDTPYGILGFEVSPIEPIPSDEGLVAIGPAYAILPGDLPVDAPMTLSLPIPSSLEHPERALIYRRDLNIYGVLVQSSEPNARTRWVRQDTIQKDGRASITTRRLGAYALMEDTDSPQLELLDLKNGQSVGSHRPRIRARVIDKGSGVDWWRLAYNDRWMLTEYDPEQDLLTWEQDEDLPAGAGTLVIEVHDHAGNTVRRELSIEITAPAR